MPVPYRDENAPAGPAGIATYPTLPTIFDFDGSSNWFAKLMPSKYVATWPCMKDAEHSYQLKLMTPGGPYFRSMPAYQSRAATFSLLSSAAFPSFVRKSAPNENWVLLNMVALAFFSPRKTAPYIPGGAWSCFACASHSAWLFGGFRPFWA